MSSNHADNEPSTAAIEAALRISSCTTDVASLDRLGPLDRLAAMCIVLLTDFLRQELDRRKVRQQ